MNSTQIAALREAIRHLQGCESWYVESVPVTETRQGETVWNGVVEWTRHRPRCGRLSSRSTGSSFSFGLISN